ncbi:MAG TPA: hypothetical protein ENK85_11265 [Saprospiraceae bacterium]|nr:hypothetical protein [Saprospiraceae bacterium]
MIEGFEGITHQEFATLRDALPMIAALVGGADGNFDAKERYWAEKMANIYSFSKGESLDAFFKKVADHFSDRADAVYRHHQGLEERNKFLSEELAKLNDIFPKLRPMDAYKLYRSFLQFADEVAHASGGIFRMGSVDANEAKWAKLPMVKPVPKPIKPDPEA